MSSEASGFPAPIWRVFADESAVVAAARDTIATTAEAAIAARGAFRIVLAGGRTPERLYRELRTLPADWSRWYIYFGDERCLPAGDPNRNDTMADTAWLDAVDVPRGQVKRIPSELGALRAARAYAQTLSEVGRFDLVLLGLGEDGHTASLFPGDEAGFAPDAPDAIAVFAAPKPPPERVSMSAARLAAAERVIFLVLGANKRIPVAHWRAGDALPAARILAPKREVWSDPTACDS
ncbi:MAG: 6-phosphogluconolactonase [Thiotrichales bacterium]